MIFFSSYFWVTKQVQQIVIIKAVGFTCWVFYFQPGGAKIGTFDPYPKHSEDPYKVKVARPVNIVNKSGKTFMPSQGPKSTPMVSIINTNVLKYVYFI